MANELDGSQIVVLDRERRMKLTLDSLIALQETTGINLLQNPSEFDLKNVKFLRAAIWVALRDDDPELTLEQTGKILPTARLWDLMRIWNEVFMAAMPEKKEGTDPLASPPPGPDGSNSGQLPVSILPFQNRASRRSRRASS